MKIPGRKILGWWPIMAACLGVYLIVPGLFTLNANMTGAGAALIIAGVIGFLGRSR